LEQAEQQARRQAAGHLAGHQAGRVRGQQEEEDEEENIYSTFSVHVKGKYRFHLMNIGDGWMTSTKNEISLSESERQLAEKVEDLLIALI